MAHAILYILYLHYLLFMHVSCNQSPDSNTCSVDLSVVDNELSLILGPFSIIIKVLRNIQKSRHILICLGFFPSSAIVAELLSCFILYTFFYSKTAENVAQEHPKAVETE